jgi:ribosomal protein L37AE/L43A
VSASFRVEFANTSSFTPRGVASRLDFGTQHSLPVLSKCGHGVYKAGEKVARYCVFCSPETADASFMPGRTVDSRQMSFAARYQSSPRRKRMTANKSEKNSNACPQCGSDYRFAIENSLLVECSECSTLWRPIRRGDSVHSKEVAA